MNFHIAHRLWRHFPCVSSGSHFSSQIRPITTFRNREDNNDDDLTNRRRNVVKKEKALHKWLKLDTYYYKKWKLANAMGNRFEPERVVQMGPDFACLEWLMNAGATSVLMSDGTQIRSRREMRDFLERQGYNVQKLKMEAPASELLKDFNLARQLGHSLTSDAVYERRWQHISPIHMKEVDASDAVLTSRGCNYFLECRSIEKLKLNFCDYIDDEAIALLAQGRTSKSLKELEIVFNPMITDAGACLLVKLRALRRLHLYFLSKINTDTKRAAVLHQLKIGLPTCKCTFPEVFFIGMGYESEQEKVAYRKSLEAKGWFARQFG